jgi:hypothetical protein
VSNAGQPPYYKTVEELQEAIDNYFLNPTQNRTVKIDDELIKVPIFTISGFAYALGFESRQSIYDYGKNAKFSYTIKRACLFIESQYEAKLSEANPTGAIFALKSMGWKDTQEIHSKVESVGEVKIVIRNSGTSND